uniref:Uncharacterized protein n=1 Tax=Lygus hesperus TaxID=30085 RepID=A0A146L6S8_LYGHE
MRSIGIVLVQLVTVLGVRGEPEVIRLGEIMTEYGSSDHLHSLDTGMDPSLSNDNPEAFHHHRFDQDRIEDRPSHHSGYFRDHRIRHKTHFPKLRGGGNRKSLRFNNRKRMKKTDPSTIFEHWMRHPFDDASSRHHHSQNNHPYERTRSFRNTHSLEKRSNNRYISDKKEQATLSPLALSKLETRQFNIIVAPERSCPPGYKHFRGSCHWVYGK